MVNSIHNHSITLKKINNRNLKNLDLEFFSGEFIVLTGISGSGKSSLAFNTIYNEGRLNYLASVSSRLKAYFKNILRGEVESIEGLPPTIALSQQSIVYPKDSTVGTISGIDSLLKLLYTHAATFYDPKSKHSILIRNREHIMQKVLSFPQGTELKILFPLKILKKDIVDSLKNLGKQGFLIGKFQGVYLEIDKIAAEDIAEEEIVIEILVDSLKISLSNASDIKSSILRGLKKGNSRVNIIADDEELYFLQKFLSPFDDIQYMASENHPSQRKNFLLEARLFGKTFPELSDLTFLELKEFLKKTVFETNEEPVVVAVKESLLKRIHYLIELGLDYLSCRQSTDTLSKGETQRINLASAIGTGSTGLIYVLDEPSTGLHPKDTLGLIKTILALKHEGNTVIVVEHDNDIILSADRIIDMGPGSGNSGGRITFNGSVKEFLRISDSVTAKFLRKENEILIPKNRRISDRYIILKGAKTHNLKNVNLKIPLKSLTVVTGISGSGKSSLINDTLVPGVENVLKKRKEMMNRFDSIEVPEDIRRVVNIDCRFSNQNVRSTLVTFIKAFDNIRHLFASLPLSEKFGYSPAYFSFNLKEGACPVCLGLGINKSDFGTEELSIICNYCKGLRFSDEILTIRFQGKNIGEVLKMTVSEAMNFFSNQSSIQDKISQLCTVGLDYLELGRSLNTLSGGEVQRLKLASELLTPKQQHTLYILDEPTIGLHLYDIQNLVKIVNQLLIDHTVIIIEHNMHLVKTADLIIDMGPGRGSRGGRVIDSGTPEEIIKIASPTGQSLKKVFSDTMPQIKKYSKHNISVSDNITLLNAHKNNLKHINLSVPRNKITVVSGPCASGKHSFLMGTLYAQGMRFYAQTLPLKIRSSFYDDDDPCVSKITNLLPVIAVKKRNKHQNSENTLASLTGIDFYFHKLFVMLGVGYCPATGERIVNVTEEHIIDLLFREQKDSLITVAAPISFEKVKECIRKGFIKFLINDSIIVAEEITFEFKNSDKVAVIIDHFKVKKRSRVIKAIQEALSINPERILIHGTSRKHTFFMGYVAPSTGKKYPPIIPSLFSPDNYKSHCTECLGSGYGYKPDLLKNDSLTIRQILKYFSPFFPEILMQETFQGISIDKPLNQLSDKHLNYFLYGNGPSLSYDNQKLDWKGFSYSLSVLANRSPATIRKELRSIMSKTICNFCDGSGLNPFVRNIRVFQKTIIELMNMSVDELRLFITENISDSNDVDSDLKRELEDIERQLSKRLNIIQSFGMGYLQPKRHVKTLSDGESYKLRFGNKIINNLTGIIYLMEDPLSYFHPEEQKVLFDVLEDLKNKNNTIIISGNNKQLLLQADNKLCFGPEGGANGGYLMPSISSIKNKIIRTSSFERSQGKVQNLILQNFTKNNLKNISLSVPLQSLVSISGISGSGKSTLVFEGIRPQAEVIKDMELFEEIVEFQPQKHMISQKSDVGAYLRLTPKLKKFFSMLPNAKRLCLSEDYFNPRSKEGQCSVCQGKGYQTFDIEGIVSSRSICRECDGFGLNPIIQEVRYKNRHFGEMLTTSLEIIGKLLSFDSEFRELFKLISLFRLNDLYLGKNLCELSFGEYRKLQIVQFLNKYHGKQCLYLLDGISSELDEKDVFILTATLRNLVSKGNSVIFIDNNPDMIKASHFLVELGFKTKKQTGVLLYSGETDKIFEQNESVIKKYL